MKRRLLLLFIFAGALLTMGAGESISSRFDSIGHKLVCTCGCNQILLECNHVGCPDSSRMIDELRGQLGSGAADTSIFNWFAAKYGPIVLAAPIRGGFDTVAWIVPGSLTLLAFALVFWIVHRWKKRNALAIATPSPTSAAADDLRERIRKETEY